MLFHVGLGDGATKMFPRKTKTYSQDKALQENTKHSDGNSDGDEICRNFMTHF